MTEVRYSQTEEGESYRGESMYTGCHRIKTTVVVMAEAEKEQGTLLVVQEVSEEQRAVGKRRTRRGVHSDQVSEESATLQEETGPCTRGRVDSV
jgi:hypothetical protein